MRGSSHRDDGPASSEGRISSEEEFSRCAPENLVVVVLLAVVASVFVAAVSVAAQDPAAIEAALSLDRPTRRLIQQGLSNEGFDAGALDGLFGPRTRAAIRAWQAAREQAETGYLDDAQASGAALGWLAASIVGGDRAALTNYCRGVGS